MAELLQHVPSPTKHRDGTVLVLEQMLKVEHHIGDDVVQRVVKTLLNGPSGQASYDACGFRHLALKQQHHLVGEQVLGRLRSVIDHTLDHVQSTFHGTVEQGHGIPLFAGVFQTFQDRSKSAHGGAVLEERLCKRFLGQPGAKHPCLVDVPKRGFMRFGQCLGLLGQMRHFSLALSSLDPKVTKFTQNAAPFLEQFPQLTFEVAAAHFVLPPTFEFVVSTAARGTGFGLNRSQIGLRCTNGILCNGEVPHR
jgi:hypothetical protein